METALALPVKEVEQTNKEVMALQEFANALTVTHPDHLNAASDLLENIKNASNVITTRKEEITRPLMRSLASVRDLFKPLELALDNAKKVANAKVAAFQTIQEEKLAQERARIEARVEKGTMRTDTAASKLAEITDAPKTVGKMTIKMYSKVRITDETLLPREYLVPDMTKITSAILKEGVEVPGAEKYMEKVIATRASL